MRDGPEYDDILGKWVPEEGTTPNDAEPVAEEDTLPPTFGGMERITGEEAARMVVGAKSDRSWLGRRQEKRQVTDAINESLEEHQMEIALKESLESYVALE